MGYVHDKHMSQFIPPTMFDFSAGTWAQAIASNVVSMNKSAADESFTAIIPILIPSNSVALKGAKLLSIDVWYSIGTTLADDFATVELEKVTLAADDTAPTGAAVTTTCDAGHDSAAERKAVDDDHCMTVTITTPAWVDDGDAYYLQLVVDCAAGTVFKFFGARANFELRV
jgi:hypothetical protein